MKIIFMFHLCSLILYFLLKYKMIIIILNVTFYKLIFIVIELYTYLDNNLNHLTI
jgi:hypothetical protein